MSVRTVLCAACLVFAAGELRADDAKVKQARADAEARRERVAWAERMAKQGYISDAQLRGERVKLAAAEAAVLTAEGSAARPDEGFFAGLARRFAARVGAAQGKVKAAEVQLEMARERAAWSDRMVKKGFLTAAQAQVELARVTEADAALRKATDELDALRPRPEKK